MANPKLKSLLLALLCCMIINMKSSLLAVAIILSACLIVASPVLAHPGNTDAYGGHTCKTNCESWGLSYGEYHYHNSGYYEDDYYDQGSEAGLGFIDENSSYIVGSAENEGRTDGSLDGSSGDLEYESPDFDSVCSEVNFEDDSSPQDYYDGFIDSYSDSCRDVYNENYSSSYASAYMSALKLYEEENLSTDETEEVGNEEGSNWLINFFPYATVGMLLMLIGNWDAIKTWWRNQ